MTIRAKLLITVGAALVAVAAFVAVVAHGGNRVEVAIDDGTRAARVLQRVAEVTSFTNEYIIHESPQAEEQWRTSYAALTELVADPAVDQALRDDVAAMGAAFGELVVAREGVDVDIPGSARERIAALTGQLSITTGAITADANAQSERARADLISTQDWTFRLTLGLTILLFLLFVGMGVGVYFTVVRPIARMTATANRVAEGVLSSRADTNRRDELGVLGNAFNLMTERVKETVDTLEERVAERTAELEHRSDELARSNAELESFTHSVSHDLKEPLRSLHAFSGFLMEDYAEQLDDTGKEHLERISRASMRMKHLVDDLLEVSVLGRKSVAGDRVDLPEVLDEIVESLQVSLDENGGSIVIEPNLPPVQADAGHVEQAFANLISNGLKFNQSEHPTVHVGIQDAGEEMATFYVRDNGIGIDPVYHERVFQMFQRLQRREEYPGTGAGLSIVKRIVELYGGKISLDSTPGEGTTLFFTLPLWVEAPRAVEFQAA